MAQKEVLILGWQVHCEGKQASRVAAVATLLLLVSLLPALSSPFIIEAMIGVAAASAQPTTARSHTRNSHTKRGSNVAVLLNIYTLPIYLLLIATHLTRRFLDKNKAIALECMPLLMMSLD